MKQLAFWIVLCLISVQQLMAQKYIVSGVVTDKHTNESLAGANVYIPGTSVGVSADAKGNYIIRDLAPGNYTLKVSFIGYKSRQFRVEVRKDVRLDIVLQNAPSIMDEIVVTGTGTEHYLKDAPVQTEVITAKALSQYAGRNVEDLLNAVSPSMSFNQNDMGSKMQMNGLGNDYILILLDGRRINGDVGGQNDMSLIDLHNIERVEIVKGASSSLYGSDAIAGVINFISKKNHSKLTVSNTSRIGSYGDVNQSNSIAVKDGRWNSITSVNFKHTDGWKNTNQEWHRDQLYENSVTRTVNRSSNYKVAEKLSYQATEHLSLTADASFYQKWTVRPSGIPLWRLNDLYYRDQNYALGAKYMLTKKNYLTLDASFGEYNYYYDYTQREYTDDFDGQGSRIVYYPGDRVLQTSQRRLLTELKGVFYLTESNTLSAGLEYNGENLKAPFRLKNNKASAYTLSAYAQDEWNILKALNVTAGIRLVQHKEFGQTVTPKVALMYKLKDFNFRATYSYGFKTPTIKELYYAYIATIMSKLKAYYGDENLKPQTSNYYALGVEYHSRMLKTSVTGYYNDIRNMISLQPIATSPEDKLLEVEETMKYMNLTKARVYGLDFTFNLEINPGLSLGGGYSYVDSESQDPDPESKTYLKYVPVNNTSEHTATIQGIWGHDWKRYRLGVGVYGRYQSERYYLQDGNGKAYNIWRLNTTHSLLKTKKWKFDLNAGVDNLFDYIDRTPFGYNRGTTTPGRTYYASLSIKFQNQ